ncbi:hypothetical protein EKO27_g9816 [Xylaria grammica]|uniref:Fucose-specific lectin n=1 Tax=Xylaria grammica TaxID=363999 RepID=A0A439CT15_9PEZI|nr:hypothetical protein EKO27_g9816 [Xylaria grammica]
MPLFYSTNPQAGGAGEEQGTGCYQPEAATCQQQDYVRACQDHDQGDGIEVRYPSGIEVDQSRMPPWVEFDPHAPLHARSVSKEANAAVPDQETMESKALVALLILAIIGAGVGGGVGATVGRGTRRQGAEQDAGNRVNTTTIIPPSLILGNSSVTAVHWKDSSGNKEYRVYVQEKDGSILEAAWASNMPTWNSSRITEEGYDIMLGTPLTSSVGYPHADSTLSLVKNVYYLGRAGTLYERQSPVKRVSVWGEEHANGLYTTSTDSTTLALWYETFDPLGQILAVVFQGADSSLSIAKYTSNGISEGPWSINNTGLQLQVGSALAAAPIGSGTGLRLYVAGTKGAMQVYQYNLTSDEISNPISTNLDILPHAALSISTQDNRDYFTSTTLPECATRDGHELTDLILFSTPDRSSLNFISWNCSSGFLDQTSYIAPLLQANRTYLGLTGTLTSFNPEDQRVYVLFDAGNGPEIEEWEVPPGAQNANWKVLGRVPVILP